MLRDVSIAKMSHWETTAPTEEGFHGKKVGSSQLTKQAGRMSTQQNFKMERNQCQFCHLHRIKASGIASFLGIPSCDGYIHSGDENIYFKGIWWAARDQKEMIFLRDMSTNPGKFKQYLFIHIVSKNFLESTSHFSGMDWINLRSWLFF